MKPKKHTSLSELYQQRKQAHPLPESFKRELEQSLQQKLSTRNKLRQFKIIIPTAVASMLAVIIIWPNADEVIYEADYALAPTPTATPLRDEGLDIPLAERLEQPAGATEEKEVLTTAPIATSNIERPLSSAPIYPSAPAAQRSLSKTEELAAKKTTSIEEPMFLLNIEEEAIAVEVLADEYIESERTQYLKIINGEQGVFENCAGERIELDFVTALQRNSWVEVTFENNTEIKLEAAENYSCPAVVP